MTSPTALELIEKQQLLIDELWKQYARVFDPSEDSSICYSLMLQDVVTKCKAEADKLLGRKDELP